MSEKQCRFCGGELENALSGVICRDCGKRAEDITESAVDITPQDESVNTPKNNSKKKVRTIIISVLASLIVIIIAISSLWSHSAKMRPIKNKIEDITEYVQQGEYERALECIKEYKEYDYSGKSKKHDEQVEAIYNEIDSMLYNSISSHSYDDTIRLGNYYIDNYPNGKHLSNVQNCLKTAYEEKAINNMLEAEQSIKNGDYSSAYYNLNAVTGNTYASEADKKKAQSLLKQVTPLHKILGTWKKATGVSYTFEADGHMSTDLSPNYNQSAGTTMDGLEVKMLLGDIEDFGRCVHGGTWKYLGTQESDSGTLYTYSLFYNGSQHVCFISAKNGTPLGISLASGLGDMSFLTK